MDLEGRTQSSLTIKIDATIDHMLTSIVNSYTLLFPTTNQDINRGRRTSSHHSSFVLISCCLLLNLIRGEMAVDPLENELNGIENGETNQDGDVLGTIEPLDQWTAWRDNLAMQMYDEWNRNIH
ncbi:hypothetical protein GBA52_008481 [Prunus armeniaca]|nr:hypothetical protein GBA52_008481 [Prunus armeniaca]